MTVADQIKIIDNKIVENQAQYDLDRLAAKISALSSNKLDKYVYLTGEDLGLKPSAVEQTWFEYSLLGKIFDKGLKEDEEEEQGLLKRLKNIEDKNEEQLRAVKSKTENIKDVTWFCERTLKFESKGVKLMKLELYKKMLITGN